MYVINKMRQWGENEFDSGRNTTKNNSWEKLKETERRRSQQREVQLHVLSFEISSCSPHNSYETLKSPDTCAAFWASASETKRT